MCVCLCVFVTHTREDLIRVLSRLRNTPATAAVLCTVVQGSHSPSFPNPNISDLPPKMDHVRTNGSCAMCIPRISLISREKKGGKRSTQKRSLLIQNISFFSPTAHESGTHTRSHFSRDIHPPFVLLPSEAKVGSRINPPLPRTGLGSHFLIRTLLLPLVIRPGQEPAFPEREREEYKGMKKKKTADVGLRTETAEKNALSFPPFFSFAKKKMWDVVVAELDGLESSLPPFFQCFSAAKKQARPTI